MDNEDLIAIDPILKYFEFEEYGGIENTFSDIAYMLVTILPRNPERTVALRKLLEAKDAAVRAAL